VASAVDARRLFLGLLDQGDVPPRLLDEVRRIHVGLRNVSELEGACEPGPFAPAVQRRSRTRAGGLTEH
jgi:hypothetical protein